MRWNHFHYAIVFVGGGRKQGKVKDTIDHCEGGQKSSLNLAWSSHLSSKLNSNLASKEEKNPSMSSNFCSKSFKQKCELWLKFLCIAKILLMSRIPWQCLEQPKLGFGSNKDPNPSSSFFVFWSPCEAIYDAKNRLVMVARTQARVQVQMDLSPSSCFFSFFLKLFGNLLLALKVAR